MAPSPTRPKQPFALRPLTLGAIVAAAVVAVLAFVVMGRDTSPENKRTGPTTLERLEALREREARRDDAASADGALGSQAAGADDPAAATRGDTMAAPGMPRQRLADRSRAFGDHSGGIGAAAGGDTAMTGSGSGSQRDKKMKRKRRHRGDDAAGDIAVAPQPSRHTILATEPDEPYDTQTQAEAGDLKDLDAANGSVSFWVQPGWDQTSQDDAAFVTIGEGLRVYKNVNFLRVEVMGENGQKVGLGMPINEWKPGEWHQVATSWGPEGLSLYVDGKVVSENVHMRSLRFSEEPKLMVGTDAPLARPIASGILAEVRVRNVSLTPFDASRNFFKAGPPKM